MNRKLIFILLITLITALQAVPLRILYTGDTHGTYESTPIKDSKSSYGGYIILENFLTQERQSVPRSIYLDSGDQQTGTIFSTLVESGVHGGAVIEVFNRLGLDACTFGNHEFDFSFSNTRDMVKIANYPFVSTNLLNKTTRQSFGKAPYTIIERDSLRIGVLGITLELLPEKVKAENVSSLRILPPKEAIDKYLDELDAKTDLIVVLTHQGFEADSLLAQSLDNRVDMIIGGHDHIWAEQPYLVNGIYLLYSGSHLNFLGAADLDVENDRIASLKNQLIPLVSHEEIPTTPLAEYIHSRAERIEAEMGKVLGYIPEDWIPDKYVSTAVSKWVANSLKAEYQSIYHPDIAIINNGGIRKSIPAGAVTLGDMYELLPFNNTVVVFSCYGRDLIKLDNLNAHNAIAQPHDICEIAGLTWTEVIVAGVYGSTEPWAHESYKVNGIPIEPDKVYRVVSHDYIVGQGDKYLGFQPIDVYDTGELLLDAMIRQVQKQFAPAEESGRD